jgi:hypothetical protein
LRMVRRAGMSASFFSPSEMRTNIGDNSLGEVTEHLLNCARQGDSEALSVLYRRFLPGIFGYIAARVADRTLAEDLTSEVFLQMVEGIHRLRAENETGFSRGSCALRK